MGCWVAGICALVEHRCVTHFKGKPLLSRFTAVLLLFPKPCCVLQSIQKQTQFFPSTTAIKKAILREGRLVVMLNSKEVRKRV
jgi:hypothetical protein